MENLANKVTGNAVAASEWNQLPGEVQNVITQAGLVLTSSDVEQLGQAIAALGMGNAYYEDAGVGADVYVLNPVSGRQGAKALVDGMFAIFRPNFASSGTVTATVDVNSIGVKNVKREDGTDLKLDDLTATKDAILRYDLGNDRFHLLDFVILKDAETAHPKGYVDGFAHSINGVDAANDVDVAVGGVCRDAADTQNIVGTAMTKRIDANWLAGTNAGGFPSALTLTNDTWYRLFVIAQPDGTVDYGWDTSATATNLLADATGYTKYRQIGWTRRGTAANVAYVQNPDDLDEVDWDVPVRDHNAAPTTTAASVTVLAPPSTTARVVVLYDGDSVADADVFGLISSLAMTDTAPSATAFNCGGQRDLTGGVSLLSFVGLAVVLDASSQLRSRWTTTLGTISVSTTGYRYRRGKN